MQKIFADLLTKNLIISTSQLIGPIRKFVMEWGPKEVSIPSNSDNVEERRKSVLDMDRNATTVVESAPPMTWFISVKKSWFNEYVTKVMGPVHDCYIVKISNDFRTFTFIGDVTPIEGRETIGTQSDA